MLTAPVKSAVSVMAWTPEWLAADEWVVQLLKLAATVAADDSVVVKMVHIAFPVDSGDWPVAIPKGEGIILTVDKFRILNTTQTKVVIRVREAVLPRPLLILTTQPAALATS